MSGEINRVPQGLLSLLDMKARGQVPRVLAPEVSISLDILQLYLLQDRRSVQSTIVVTGTGQQAFGGNTIVPQNEVWYVWQHTQRTTASLVGASGVLRWAPGSFFNPNGRQYQVGDVLPYQAQAGDVPCVSVSVPYLMGPGDRPCAFIHEYVAFAPDPTLAAELLVTPIQI